MFRANIQALPKSLRKRFTFQQHNFLEPPPQDGGNKIQAYILRMVLWNWADDVAILILRGFIPVMQHSFEIALLINDAICCSLETVESHIEKDIRHLNMAMMVLNNVKVRTEQEWRELLTKVSPNFKVWIR